MLQQHSSGLARMTVNQRIPCTDKNITRAPAGTAGALLICLEGTSQMPAQLCRLSFCLLCSFPVEPEAQCFRLLETTAACRLPPGFRFAQREEPRLFGLRDFRCFLRRSASTLRPDAGPAALPHRPAPVSLCGRACPLCAVCFLFYGRAPVSYDSAAHPRRDASLPCISDLFSGVPKRERGAPPTVCAASCRHDPPFTAAAERWLPLPFPRQGRRPFFCPQKYEQTVNFRALREEITFFRRCFCYTENHRLPEELQKGGMTHGE